MRISDAWPLRSRATLKPLWDRCDRLPDRLAWPLQPGTAPPPPSPAAAGAATTARAAMRAESLRAPCPVRPPVALILRRRQPAHRSLPICDDERSSRAPRAKQRQSGAAGDGAQADERASNCASRAAAMGGAMRVLICGGGVIGACIAYFLSRAAAEPWSSSGPGSPVPHRANPAGSSRSTVRRLAAGTSRAQQLRAPRELAESFDGSWGYRRLRGARRRGQRPAPARRALAGPRLPTGSRAMPSCTSSWARPRRRRRCIRPSSPTACWTRRRPRRPPAHRLALRPRAAPVARIRGAWSTAS